MCPKSELFWISDTFCRLTFLYFEEGLSLPIEDPSWQSVFPHGSHEHDPSVWARSLEGTNENGDNPSTANLMKIYTEDSYTRLEVRVGIR